MRKEVKTINIPPSLHKKVKIASATKGVPINDFVKTVLENALKVVR